MSTSAVVSRKRLPWLQIQKILVFVGLVAYALLASLNRKPPLLVMMLTILIMGNVIAPVAFLTRRIYRDRPFPWNWVLFAPVQLVFAFLCAVGTVVLLEITKIDPETFRPAFARSGYLVVVMFLVVSVITFAIEQFSRKLRERNELLEQTVEKGTIALQEQEAELKRAGEIQQMLLPSTLPQLNRAQISGAWQPAREVGGDYFDVIQFDDHRVGICVGDVAGKGITAALLMANLQASFRAFATPDASPGLVCAKLNQFLCANTAAGKFVTFFYAVVDVDRRTLVYENAGHCPGLLLRENGEMESLRGGGAVLGVLPDWSYRDSMVQLGSGDKLLLATDGITEAENPHLEEFGEQRLLSAARAQDGTALDTRRAIMQCVTAFCGGNFRDDATLLVLRLL